LTGIFFPEEKNMNKMRASFATAVFVGLGLMLSACAHLQGDGSVTLIDGDKGLDNWNRFGEANWRVDGGAIVADKGKGGFLVSRDSYKDFVIKAEFWAEATTNSGIFIRCDDPGKLTAAGCYEVNIWDTRPEPKYGTAAIVDHAAVPVPIVHRAAGRWSTFEITAKGKALTVKFNDVVTVNIEDGKHPAGPFALQFANGDKGAPGGVIKWRKVQIRSL
jgi:hypothetical protein